MGLTSWLRRIRAKQRYYSGYLKGYDEASALWANMTREGMSSDMAIGKAKMVRKQITQGLHERWVIDTRWYRGIAEVSFRWENDEAHT